ncbi:hypothetical protein SME22J_08840 [Serratia marcescens]|nr:hypothetical protein SME22J_08840 [Serratia marcescens]
MKGAKAALALILLTTGTAEAVEMIFGGTLRAQACTLHPDDRVIQIDFDDVGSNELKRDGGTPDEPFNIRLQNCNANVASEVAVTFMGNQSAGIPGALALDAGSVAAGFAVVLKDAFLQPLKLGDASRSPLTGTNVALVFYRRLQVEPGSAITPGRYSASGTFELFYP